MRARDLCQALDLPIVSKNTENIRSKLKRLVSRGILVETEPGIVHTAAPVAPRRAPSPPALCNPNDEREHPLANRPLSINERLERHLPQPGPGTGGSSTCGCGPSLSRTASCAARG